MPIIKEEKLHGHPKSFGSLKKEVVGKGGLSSTVGSSVQVEKSKYSDWKHTTVDEAKKRAIYTSGSYKEFQDIVATCGLNPISRNEFSKPARHQTYNRAFSGKESSGRCKEAQRTPKVAVESGRVKALDLERNLRRAKTDRERAALLRELGAEGVVRGLKSSDKANTVDPELLLCLVDAIGGAIEEGDEVLKGILEELIKDSAVSRTISVFMTPEERGRLRNIGVKAGVAFAILQLIGSEAS
ncbi:hypothetical protein FOL47_005081 [Perkinsus chesapeaki]|uniref:Dynein attachment factor N-terminal domain-containing protein n=1 Tax=Perkinsus chesapeaki TaxID=330153 RepID=A0A7J6LZ62_PERCH|nr:hypothetical protein FOL47_005081 [Perkinsus chesapeaki]